MKKVILLSSLLASTLFSAELQWGHGTIDLKSGFVGLDQTISNDIDTYSLVEQHSNISNSKFFYGYTFTIFDSKKIRQAQKDINSGISNVNSALKGAGGYVTIPALDYRLQGFDGGLTLGYDLASSNKENYLGVGGYLGISVPYIYSSKSYSNTVSVNLKMADYLKDSKTDISTYKIGLGLFGQKSLGKNASIYGSAIYAYQNGNIKNDYAKADFDVDGNYLEFSGGLKIHASKQSSLSGLYATVGLRHREWKLDNASINVTGVAGLKSPKSNFEFSSNVATLGVGYSF